jgi:peptide/nickel transport system substrate-binding protein
MRRSALSFGKKLPSLGLGLMVFLAACAPAAPSAPKAAEGGQAAKPAESGQAAKAPAKTGGSLVVGLVADPLTLDAHAVGDNNTRRAVYPVFDPLVREDPTTTKVIPALAESWEAAPDGMSYTFKLRQNVKFHDGEPFDAAAVKFNLDRQIDESHPNFKDGNWLFMRNFVGALKSVDVIDPSTVRLNLKQVDLAFLDGLSTNPTYMISPKSIKELGKDVGTKPVGTGPFKFVSWDKGNRMVLERNNDYWGEKAKVEQLIFVPIAEPEARLTALRTGQVQLTIDLPPDAVSVVQNDANLKVESKVSRSFWGLQPNYKFEPFSKVQVRQAVAYAINREQLTKDVLKGTGAPAKGVFSEVFGEYVNKQAEPYEYNPTKAKELLQAAGYGSGFQTTFLIPASGSGMQQPRAMAEYIQSNLAAVGITANLEVLEWGTYLGKWTKGDFGLSARGITPVLYDPSPFLNIFFTCKFVVPNGSNAQSSCTKEYDDVAESTYTILDPQERVKRIHQAQEMMQREVPWVFVDHELDMYFLSKRVDGMVMRGNYLIDFDKLSLQ